MNKKRFSYMILAVLLLFSCMTANSTEVSAAKNKIIEISRNDIIPDTSVDSDDMILESGRRFYIGDMVSVKLDEIYDKHFNMAHPLYYYSATELGATYTSDCPEVLAIEEKSGYAVTKEPGIANVTVNCQGAYASFPVTVVEKGTLCAGREELADKIDAAGRTLAKKIPQKLTPENGYELFQAMKTYLVSFKDYPFYWEYQGGLTAYRMLGGWNPSGKSRMAPACSCYERAYSMITHYIAKYHPMYDKKYWTAEWGQYFKVSATPGKITLTMKKKLTKQALLALYLNEFIYEVDGLGPDGVIPPLSVSTTVQKNRLEACSHIAKYKDNDERYRGHTVTLFKLGSKTATVTNVYRTSYNTTNGRHKHIHKKKLNLKKGKRYLLHIDTMAFYWPGEFVVK